MAPKLFRPLTNLGFGCVIAVVVVVAFLIAVWLELTL